MKARDEITEITFSVVLAMWGQYLSEVTDRFVEKHVVLRALRMRTACSSPIHRHLRARRRRKLENRLLWVGRQLELNEAERENNFKVQHELHADQALLQAELRDL